MSQPYSYGPLKSDYFSQFEKMWIEGFCKERKIELSESNVCTTLSMILKDKSPEAISAKIKTLINEAEKFSSYSKDMFIKSWNNILGFAMSTVKPGGTINENQMEAMKKTNHWWLMEAPKIMSTEMQYAYFKSLVVECLAENGKALNELKDFNPAKSCRIIENAKKYFSYEKVKMKFPPCTIRTEEIRKNEVALNMIPESEKIIAMISWTAETTKLISMFK